MKTLKRWIKNIGWLFNHPPTGMIDLPPNSIRCWYCGSAENCIKWGDVFVICFNCMSVVFDKILHPEPLETKPLSGSELYQIRKHLERATAKRKK